MKKETNSVSNQTWREATKDLNILAYIPASSLPGGTEELSSQESGANSLTKGDFHNVLARVSHRVSEPEPEKNET